MSYFLNLLYRRNKGVFMRNDITEVLREFLMNGIKPNYSKLARQFNCDPRTEKGTFKIILH